MKYEIEGISKNKTVKKFIKKANYIKVIYLDGYIDIIENNDDNYENLVELMKEQAKTYATGSTNIDAKKENIKRDSLKLIAIIVFGMFLIIVAKIIEFEFFIPSYLLIISTSIALPITTICFLYNIIKTKKQVNDLEKYSLFVKESNSKMLDFNKIKAKESYLTKKKSNDKEIPDITKLDKFKLKQIKEIIEKVDRYRTLDKSDLEIEEEPKTLTKKRNMK